MHRVLHSMLRNLMSLCIQVFYSHNLIKFWPLCTPKSLANLMVEVGTMHSHQILLPVQLISKTSFCKYFSLTVDRTTLRWRHNERDSVSNHQPHDCLLNRLFKEIIKAPRHWPLCGEFTGDRWIQWPVTRKMFPFDDVIMSYEDLTYRKGTMTLALSSLSWINKHTALEVHYAEIHFASHLTTYTVFAISDNPGNRPSSNPILYFDYETTWCLAYNLELFSH